MSEHVLRVLLSELQTIRLLCQNPRCGATVEFQLDRWDRIAPTGFECPVCKERFHTSSEDATNCLKLLAEAVQGFCKAKDKVKVEFIIKEPA